MGWKFDFQKIFETKTFHLFSLFYLCIYLCIIYVFWTKKISMAYKGFQGWDTKFCWSYHGCPVTVYFFNLELKTERYRKNKALFLPFELEEKPYSKSLVTIHS